MRHFRVSWNSSPIWYVLKKQCSYFCYVTQANLFPTDYVDQQDGISTRSHGRALVQNNDFIGVASYNIFVGIAVATIFGSGFFFDLFWPERHESASVKMAWKICSIVVSIMALADAIAMTVRYRSTRVINQLLITLQVIVASHKAYITGVSPAEAEFYIRQNGPPNLNYKKNADCVASVVILWPGVVASFARSVCCGCSVAWREANNPTVRTLCGNLSPTTML
jgi:uncharacterized membrane protein